MVRKTTSALACLLPARFKAQEKHAEFVDGDPFRVRRDTAFVRSRANTAPSYSHGDIGESPSPALRSTSPPVRQKRSSFTTFFAFSSKKKPDIQSVHGTWISAAQTQVHLINHSAIPSPLRTDEEYYYYSYYTSPEPPNVRVPRCLSQDRVGNPDLDSSQPVHTHQHPYAYSTPLGSSPRSKTTTSLRHTTSQTFQLPPDPPVDISPTLVYSRATSSHVHTSQSHTLPRHPTLKTSHSTPNLAASAAPIRAKSLTKKGASTRSKVQERWLSAETWWDAILSPSPRFKVRQAPRPHTATGSKPVEAGPSKSLGVTFPSLPAARPRAVSAVSNVRPTVPTLARSRSAVDLGRTSTSAPRSTFEPALETLVDDPILTPDVASSRNSELLSLEPPLSLAQVIDEGQAFEEQRKQWKRQATQSIGNKRTRSFSRARSKSLSEKHVHGHASESTRVHFNLEVLAARSLLGSQSTMPTVHVLPGSPSHSKAYSHSHSLQSHTHSSNSRAYSHSHSHSLTTSNSSKSSRNPRAHSRSGSWSRTALLKAGALCGIGQDEPHSVDNEKVPPSSRADLQGVIQIGPRTSDTAQAPSPDVPTDEVGIAISSSPPLEVPVASTPGHSPKREHGDHETRRSSRPSHRSSEYAGPHPSAIDTNLPQLAAASTVSLRHRLPPRAIYPPISPIAHPYRMASTQSEQGSDKAKSVSLRALEPSTERTVHHISLKDADFEQYGVGEALVYASLPRPVPSKTQPADPHSERPEEPEEQSMSREPVVLHRDESNMTITPPSLTNSTIQMVMSAFNNPDDLDEFQDLFYRPQVVSGDGDPRAGLGVGVELPIDVRSSASSSPLTHLVRKLSEEVHAQGSRTPSDTAQRLDPSHENVAGGIVFAGLARSASPLPMSVGSGETQWVMVPQDVGSVYTASMLEQENDTFGFPIKHGQLEAVTAPSPTRTVVRVSTHPSIAEATADPQSEPDVEDAPSFTYLSPAPRRPRLPTPDGLRSSCVTTSDVSRVSMSGLFDFPLPPNTRPGEEPVHASVLRTYFDATASESEVETRSRSDGGDPDSEEEGEALSGDVGETVHALREERVTSYDSRRTFGEYEDSELHRAGS